MIDSFDGGLIDTSSVILIINKLKLYIENEEKIIENIQNSLSLLENYYSGDNNKTINYKKNNLYEALNTGLKNKKKYIDYLEYIVNNYIDKDNSIMSKFQKDIN